jgi:hypothetical protein
LSDCVIYNCILRCRANDENALEVDFAAFDFSAPHLTLSSSIGNGFNFVAKFITSKLSGRMESAQPLVDYLLTLKHQGDVWESQSLIHLRNFDPKNVEFSIMEKYMVLNAYSDCKFAEPYDK